MPSQSAGSSPSILVLKSDSTFRFCTDYHKIIAVTKPDSFPLPRMEDCVDRVGSACYVTKLDLNKGYRQIPLTPRASEIDGMRNFVVQKICPVVLCFCITTFGCNLLQ